MVPKSGITLLSIISPQRPKMYLGFFYVYPLYGRIDLIRRVFSSIIFSQSCLFEKNDIYIYIYIYIYKIGEQSL